jgi:proteasome maturation protein
MSQLKLSQGLYAPFKINMEREFAKKVGRLPCLRSSNLMLSVLKGTDDTLEVEDILNSNILFLLE